MSHRASGSFWYGNYSVSRKTRVMPRNVLDKLFFSFSLIRAWKKSRDRVDTLEPSSEANWKISLEMINHYLGSDSMTDAQQLANNNPFIWPIFGWRRAGGNDVAKNELSIFPFSLMKIGYGLGLRGRTRHRFNELERSAWRISRFSNLLTRIQSTQKLKSPQRREKKNNLLPDN